MYIKLLNSWIHICIPDEEADSTNLHLASKCLTKFYLRQKCREKNLSNKWPAQCRALSDHMHGK